MFNLLCFIKENYKTPLREPESNPQKSPRGIENLGFWKSTNNLNLDDEQLKQVANIEIMKVMIVST